MFGSDADRKTTWAATKAMQGLTQAMHNLAKSVDSYVTMKIVDMTVAYGEGHTREMIESGKQLKKELEL